VFDIAKVKLMLMLAMKSVTITLLPVRKIVHALATVQMDVHVVMMKLTVQTDPSSSTQKTTIDGIISRGARIILHQTSLQMKTVNNTGLKKLLSARKPVITRMTIAKLVATMIHFVWTFAQKQDNVVSMIAHVKNTAFLVVLV